MATKRTAPRRTTPTAAVATKPAAAAAAPARRREGPIKVRAIEMGYYEHVRRRVGDVFVIDSMKAFSSRWMEEVDPRTPERITTGVQELRQKHDEIIRDRNPAKGTPLAHDGLADGEKNPLGA